MKKIAYPFLLLRLLYKNKVFFLLSTFCLLLFEAVAYGQSPNCYRITFSDKNDSPYSVNRPEEFLSPRAIAKRERFNIPIIEQDLPVNPHYIDSILNFSSEPSQIIATSKWNNSVVIFYPETENSQNIIDDMVEYFPFIVDVLPVAYYQLPFFSKTLVPTLKRSSNANEYLSASCDYDYGNSIDNIKLHKGELLHKAGFCGEGMLICVFDAGYENFNTISYFQPLYENGQIWGTRDLVPGLNDVYMGNAHGLSVMSLMASAIEGQLIGSAPKANYFLFRTVAPYNFNNLAEEDFCAKAAEIADSLGADIATFQLSYSDNFDYEWQNIYTPNDNNGMTSLISRSAFILAQKGIVVVVSAGNDGLAKWHYIGHPADAKDILAVGAVNKYGLVNNFSSYGPSADGRVKPDVAALGSDVWCVNEKGKIVHTGTGTSVSAPLIAGLAACLWQALPQYSSFEITDLIRKYGDRYNNPDDRTGYGIPNFYQCYLDHYAGVPEKGMTEFLVYPNPTRGELRIEMSDMRSGMLDMRYEIFDIYGRKMSQVSNLTSSIHLINISHLPAGIYFVKISTETGIVTQKVVKL